MAGNFKKLSMLILLPFVFSACEFSVKSSVKPVRMPQSVDPNTEPENENNAETTLNNSSDGTESTGFEEIGQRVRSFVSRANEMSEGGSEIIQNGNNTAATESQREILRGVKDGLGENSDRSAVCSLPREMIKPEVYDKYCGNGCLPPSQRCEDHADCCSHNCSGGVCQPGNGSFVPIGKRCQQATDCETGLCEPHPQQGFKICYGSLSRGICSFVSEPCLNADNCCSLRCSSSKKCIGSPKNPARTGQPCYNDHDECASNQCNFTTHRCR